MSTILLIAVFALTGLTSAQEENGCFPDCVGMDGSGCKSHVERAAPNVKGKVYVLPWNSVVTMDYRLDRVRIFVDDNGKVERRPCRG